MYRPHPSWVVRLGRSIVPARPRPPVYHLPPVMMARCVGSALRHQRRDVWHDVIHLSDSMRPQPLILGIENVPTIGVCVVLPNHYERKDAIWVGWGAIAISAAIARRRNRVSTIHWVMTNTWQDCYLGPWRFPPAYLEWVLRRFSHLYGIIIMPEDVSDVPQRATALRELVRALGDPAGPVIAFHPEGGGFETLIRPPHGMGHLLSMLDSRHLTCIPTGVYEDLGRLVVRFGAPLPAGTLVGLCDAEASDAVMRAIANLVPPRDRGVYSELPAPARSQIAEPATRA